MKVAVSASEMLSTGDVIQFPEHAKGGGIPTGSSVIMTHGVPGSFEVTDIEPDGTVHLKKVQPS